MSSIGSPQSIASSSSRAYRLFCNAEDRQFKYLKYKSEGIDKENFTYSYSVIEGDALMDTLKKRKSTCKFHTKGDIEIKEDEIKGSKERASRLFKVVESYLLANPDTYN
ncbi:hypothetical protein SO802_008448 [Lithocarpus litseifolius]|uniref:Bet v I/Major latex protein domain-containing protein n=1 Tax=Lithocarpus litseifolius TaxID=425828 RepID=A0AAW2DCS5_9ROSI